MPKRRRASCELAGNVSRDTRQVRHVRRARRETLQQLRTHQFVLCSRQNRHPAQCVKLMCGMANTRMSDELRLKMLGTSLRKVSRDGVGCTALRKEAHTYIDVDAVWAVEELGRRRCDGGLEFRVVRASCQFSKTVSCAPPATVLLDRHGSPRTLGAHGVLSFLAISKCEHPQSVHAESSTLGPTGFSYTSITKFSRTLSLDGTSFIHP